MYKRQALLHRLFSRLLTGGKDASPCVAIVLHILNRERGIGHFRHFLDLSLIHICIPLVTVEASPENLCYRLPVQLNEWAMTLVSMANTGEDLFPAEVIFTKAENRIYADII